MRKNLRSAHDKGMKKEKKKIGRKLKLPLRFYFRGYMKKEKDYPRRMLKKKSIIKKNL